MSTTALICYSPMEVLYWIIVYFITFCCMEFMAWFSHKYIMHGFLWVWHKDHHKKDHDSWFERNDLFFIFYAALSVFLMVLWGEFGFWAGFPMAAGIFTYGFTYFLVHDIFIHQRFKLFRNTNHWYAKGIRRAHKIHHKNIHQHGGECFGMLWVPRKYFR